MPVVINEMVSRVSVAEGGGAMTEETLEQIVRIVMARVLEQLRQTEDRRQIQEIPHQMADVQGY